MDLDHGPMSPGTLGERKREIAKREYKKKKLSDIRRNAVMCRGDRRDHRDTDTSESSGDEENMDEGLETSS